MLACRSQVATTTTTTAATSVVSLRRSSRSTRNTAVAPLLCEQQKRNDFAKKNSSISNNNINTLRKLPEMLTASAFVSATLFAENAFAAGPDAEELKQFLIGFWNFRTGDVTSILLYTVAPIALPYLIFSQLTKQKQAKQIEILEQGGWVEFMRERELDVNILTLVQINAFVAAAEKGVLDDAMVAEFVRQLKLNEQWKKSTINVEDPRAAAATRRARAQAIIEAREEREKQKASSN